MDYKLWLDQEIWITDSRRGKRREYMGKFQYELGRWMERLGYIMDSIWKTKNVVGKWLYCIHYAEIVKQDQLGGIYYEAPNHRDWPEDRDTYEVYVTNDDIEEFLERWRTNEDFDADTRVGLRVRGEILRFIYMFIDMDSSKHGKKIARIMNDTDDEYDDDDRGDKDVYLVEAQEGWHGGGWQKV